jgi:3-hydroxyacyl-CoA dehydrogenase
MLENCNNLKLVEEYLRLGQKAMLAIKYSKIPVISALKGMALGGGSELLLHSSGVAAHIETNSGLVETGVGLIPGWGGCKEMILRSKTKEDLEAAFRNIITGKVSSSAYELQEILKIENFQIAMNVNRVLEVSKDLALESYKKQEYNRYLISVDWQKIISEFDGYDHVIATNLAEIFANNNANEEDLLKQEREIFIKLLSNKFTQDRITYMLQTGKRLKN